MVKKISKVSMYVILACIIFVVGSGCLRGFWLVPRPSSTALSYGRADPNKFDLPLVFLADAENLRQRIRAGHLVTQIELRAGLDTDDGLYTLTNDEATVIIDEGKEQYGTWIGSVKEPGVLWSVLMMGAGSGGAAAILRRIWWTEQEHQAEVEKAKNNNS